MCVEVLSLQVLVLHTELDCRFSKPFLFFTADRRRDVPAVSPVGTSRSQVTLTTTRCPQRPPVGVAMAVQLDQDQLPLTSSTNESVSFRCTGTDQCRYNYVYWYQKNETDTFTVILRIDVFVTALFTVGSSNWYWIYGSGTRLYVTDRPVVPPKVSIYPATRADLKGKSSLLCLATSMFPPEVQFSWRTQENNGPIPEGERVELREEEHAASILLIDQEDLITYQYICSVKHQGGTVEAMIKGVSFQFQCRVKLLSLVSTVMIVKSMVYCCGLSLLIIHRNKGPAD
ncbi:uncharacterized protein LOC115375426 [Myripristis murdjan]|uniref:uncharacterized protein LOC115375426 n=1 Tax=Myripristis murdjan TaxID=586833 RepID=UPI001175F712|nr:uncharacterized protein LOC115375426 [Myripristis murdjan]